MPDKDAEYPLAPPDHKHAGYVTLRRERADRHELAKIRVKMGWEPGKKDDDGDYIPDPCLTAKQAEWVVKYGSPICAHGRPSPPWLKHVDPVGRSTANKADIRAAENAITALENVSIGSITDEALANAAALPERLLALATGSDPKTGINAAKVYIKLMEALTKLDPQRGGSASAPMIAVQINTDGNAEVNVQKKRVKKGTIDATPE